MKRGLIMDKEIEKFVKKYNEHVSVNKYRFELVNDKYVWIYKVPYVELFVYIKSVKNNFVTIECTRDNVNYYPVYLKANSSKELYNKILEHLIGARYAALEVDKAFSNLSTAKLYFLKLLWKC